MGMTNNDKFFEVFGFHADDEMNILPCTNECPYLKICKESVTGNCDSFGEDWWSAEYKEPSNSEIPIGSIIDWNDCHMSEQLESISTAKKDLAVGQDFITTLSEKVTETHDEFIFETIKPYCENVVNMKISKRDLEQALLQYYGKNDLAVNCIDRAKLLKIYEDRFIELEKIKHLKDNKGAEDRQLGVNYCINILKEFPPVILQEPIKGHCKDCNYWKDSDGKYRRGLGAESQCPINTDKVYQGEGYCYMFSPKAESENKE